MRSELITCISNIIFEPYLTSYIMNVFSAMEKETEFVYVAYEECAENSKYLQEADFIVVCLNFEMMYPNVVNNIISVNAPSSEVVSDAFARCKILYNTIREYSTAMIVWFGFEDYCYQYNSIYGTTPTLECLIDRLNLSLYEMLKENDIFVDFKCLIAKTGIDHAFDIKGKYRWNVPYSKELIQIMAVEIHKQYLIYTGCTKKCLVLDCDNVLWGGVLSEIGIEKICLANYGLGKPYQDFQRFLLTMYYHGVILAVCSKNDEDDVLKVFRSHSGMLLKEENISCFKCNWENKVENIKAIANILNIGLDSMVFVDDSEFEVNAVKSMLSEVIAIRYERETIYKSLSCFNLKLKCDIENVKRRINTYCSDAKRAELKATTLTFEEYLVFLEQKVDIHITLPTELARLSELSQRTNKCTNGTRYTVEQLKAQNNRGDYILFTVSVSDKFSDLGIVGAIGICSGTLDLFTLSCRALGRGIEEQMLECIKSLEVEKIVFRDTGKNAAIQKLINSIENA